MFYPHNPNDKSLFPVDLDDLIPQGAPVRLISSVVDKLDLSELISQYENSKEGRKGFHPKMMLKVVLFGYMNNIFSLRGLEAALERDAHLMWLSCYQRPDFTTISKFKSMCVPLIKDIFSQIVTILAEKGEITLSEDLYIDGTTIRSRAARRKIKWNSQAKRFSAQADEEIQKGVKELLTLVDEGARADAEQTPTHFTTEQAREIADRVAKKLSEKKQHKGKGTVTKVRKACERKDAHDETLRQCSGRCGISPTDPDCGIMHAKEDGYEGLATPNYNVQVSTNNQYVTNYEVYDTPSDKDTMVDYVDKCMDENGQKPKTVVADAGYGCEEVYKYLEKKGINAVVKYPNYDAACRAENRGGFNPYDFKLAPEGDTLICPAGHLMEPISVEEQHTLSGFRSDSTKLHCSHCGQCEFKNKCCVPKNKECCINRKLGNIREEEKAKATLDTPEGQRKLKRRSLEPEPVFGQLKGNKHYVRFRHLGSAKVRMDLGFELMALNLLKAFRREVNVA